MKKHDKDKKPASIDEAREKHHEPRAPRRAAADYTWYIVIVAVMAVAMFVGARMYFGDLFIAQHPNDIVIPPAVVFSETPTETPTETPAETATPAEAATPAPSAKPTASRASHEVRMICDGVFPAKPVYIKGDDSRDWRCDDYNKCTGCAPR